MNHYGAIHESRMSDRGMILPRVGGGVRGGVRGGCKSPIHDRNWYARADVMGSAYGAIRRGGC